MARSIWSGAIVFGMISIPVKLYAATESKDLKFTNLHTPCKSRLAQKRWCPVDDREVAVEEIERVYEYAKNDYVPITDDDQESMPLASKGTISVTSFVDVAEIDPVYFEKTYNVEPEQIGAKPYALLMGAIKSKGVSAVAKVAMRNKEHLCILRAGPNNVLVLNTLYYPDEVRAIALPDVLVAPQELAAASSLVEMMQESFDPTQYQDGYRQAMLALIEAKHSGESIITSSTPAPAAPAMDMMAALRASLDQAAANRGAAPAPVPVAPTAPATPVAPEPRKARRGRVA